MKQRQLVAGAAALLAVWTVGGQLANASPFTFVPSGPVLIHLNDDEQFAVGNNITGPNNATPYPAINASGSEGNWGIVEIPASNRARFCHLSGRTFRAAAQLYLRMTLA